MELDALEIGKAGEHLVCADLIMKGYKAFLSDQGLTYDVIVDLDGKLIRIQVKSTIYQRKVPQRKNIIAGYLFHVDRRGRRQNKNYSTIDADMFAFVALDIKVVGYLAIKDIRKTMVLRSTTHEYLTKKGTYLENLTFEGALKNI
jgi:hypothetical protein